MDCFIFLIIPLGHWTQFVIARMKFLPVRTISPSQRQFLWLFPPGRSHFPVSIYCEIFVMLWHLDNEYSNSGYWSFPVPLIITIICSITKWTILVKSLSPTVWCLCWGLFGGCSLGHIHIPWADSSFSRGLLLTISLFFFIVNFHQLLTDCAIGYVNILGASIAPESDFQKFIFTCKDVFGSQCLRSVVTSGTLFLAVSFFVFLW